VAIQEELLSDDSLALQLFDQHTQRFAAKHPCPEKMMSDRTGTTNWPELAIGLYDRLTGRQAEIAYAFENFSVDIPSSTSAEAEHAHWKMNGTLRISTRDQSHMG
jgi:hypothetical protein